MKADGLIGPIQTADVTNKWFKELNDAAMSEGLKVFINDELGMLKTMSKQNSSIQAYKILDLAHLYRLDPVGHFFKGEDLTREVNYRDQKWNPDLETAPDFVNYFGRNSK